MNGIDRSDFMKADSDITAVFKDDTRDVQLFQTVPFKDRFEHLQDLEYEAKILLEMGLRRCPEENSMPGEDHDETKFYGDLFALRKMPFSELEELLKNVQSRNRRREILSLNSGEEPSIPGDYSKLQA